MIKLIKLSDTHYIVVDDSEIKKGDFKYCPFDDVNKIHIQEGDFYDKNEFKITHSNQPLEKREGHPVKGGGLWTFDKVKQLSLSEIEEAINGYSVEKMAENYYNTLGALGTEYDKTTSINLIIWGFKAHQELVKDMVSLSKVFEILDLYTDAAPISYLKRELEKQLLPKTEWNIEITSEGKIVLL